MGYTYTQLVAAKPTAGSIKNWVNRSDVPATDVLTEAEAFIYERLRVREMMDAEDISVAAGEYREAVPSGFLDPVWLLPFGWGDPLDYRTEDAFRPLRLTDGTRITAAYPNCFTIIGTYITFDLEFSETFGAELMSYKTPTALSAVNETNFLTVRYPTLLRHACMHRAFEHMKDSPRSDEYLKKTEFDLAEANRTNELYRRGAR